MGKQILHDRVISPELSSCIGDITKKILISLLLLVFLVDFFLNSSVQPRPDATFPRCRNVCLQVHVSACSLIMNSHFSQ